jgi:Mn2+/Fe2+ NRAMP family transporter
VAVIMLLLLVSLVTCLVGVCKQQKAEGAKKRQPHALNLWIQRVHWCVMLLLISLLVTCLVGVCRKKPERSMPAMSAERQH